MKRLVLNIGALMALFSFSDYGIATAAPIPNIEYTIGDTVGSSEGLVRPRNAWDCPPGTIFQKEPPLPANVPHATWYNTDAPPVRYQKNSKLIVHFESPETIQLKQSNGKCGATFFAYADNKELHVPNPCRYPKTDAYARLLCHELGHTNGWPGYHGD